MNLPKPILLLTEKECLRIFRFVRWRGGVYCPICGSRRLKRNGHYKECQRYVCKVCGRSFNDKTGTVFHYSHVSLSVWFLVIYLAFVLEKSTRAAAKEACLSYRACYRIVRTVMNRIYASKMKAKLRGVVEVDEFYVTAGLKGRGTCGRLNRPPRRRGLKPQPGRGTYSKDEPMILNLYQRNGPLRLEAVEEPEPSLRRLVCQCVETGSTIYTDEYPPYRLLGEEGYMHETVNHSQGEYARGDIHINHDEAIVSLFKPWLAKHRGVNKRNIPLYAATFQTLYNMRDLSNRDKFWNIIGTCLSNNIQQ